jgi:hypothetical protein
MNKQTFIPNYKALNLTIEEARELVKAIKDEQIRGSENNEADSGQQGRESTGRNPTHEVEHKRADSSVDEKENSLVSAV